MDFKLTPAQEAFKKEVADFLEEALPPGQFHEEAQQSAGQKALLDDFLQKLGDRRWLTIGWPEEFGGGGRDVVDQAILSEQMGYYQSPGEAFVAVRIVGSAILSFGTPEQKAYHLPRISRGDGVYWQVFTEPGSGSDLASLQTSARRDGDEFVINGQKVFVGDGRPPDYFYLATRTDPEAPRHHGISIFLIDRHTPGINISFLEPVAGWMKNQVFFDDVRVPSSAMMGRINEGWSHMRDTLSVERSGIAGASHARRTVEELIHLAHQIKRDGKPLIEHESVQQTLVDLLIEIEAWTLLCWQIVWLQATDRPINAEASIVAVQQKQMRPRLANAIYDVIGSYAMLKPGAFGTPAYGELELWQRESIHTHGGGTPEIQRNVIALRGLGLPR